MLPPTSTLFSLLFLSEVIMVNYAFIRSNYKFKHFFVLFWNERRSEKQEAISLKIAILLPRPYNDFFFAKTILRTPKNQWGLVNKYSLNHSLLTLENPKSTYTSVLSGSYILLLNLSLSIQTCSKFKNGPSW